MTTSPDLGLPFIDGGQAQPDVTHNESLLLLQAISKGVIDRNVNTPAVGPTIGDSYIIGAAPTGAWAGRANCVTIWSGTAWDFIPGETSAGTPITMGARQEGLRVWVNDEDAAYVWDGSAWVETGGGGSQLGVASSLASGDYFLTNRATLAWSTTAVENTRTLFQVVYVDSEITATGIAINVTVAGTGSVVDISLYNFLGSGKPGTALGTVQITSTSTGVVTANFGSPIVIPAGVYMATVRTVTSGTSPTITSGVISTISTAMDSAILRSDTLVAISGTTEVSAYLITDANLPGGSWSSGMDLTGLDMVAANTIAVAYLFRVALIKQ
jgi:hypothetical protein